MTELLNKFDAGELIGLVAVGGGLLCAMVAIISGCWCSVRRAEFTAALKQDMLSRGMSVEDIRTVLEAGENQSHKGHSARHSCRA